MPCWRVPGVAAAELVIGSKVFTESVILGEIAAQLARDSGEAAKHRRELGGTRVLWSALERGDIDCYPEYSGTLRAEIFAQQSIADDAQLRAALARAQAWASQPLGFNNTYVLGMRRERAQQLGIERMSQLAAHPKLRLGFSNEFLERADGWPGLRARYRLTHEDVRGLNHDLAYRALADRRVWTSRICIRPTPRSCSTTSSRWQTMRSYFPVYDALFVCRDDVSASVRDDPRSPGRPHRCSRDDTHERSRKARSRAGDAGRRGFPARAVPVSTPIRTKRSRAERLLQRTREHLAMVGISLGAAILVAIPLGVLAFYRRRIGRVVFAVADVLQTLPALALLVFLIPWLGIGYAPAVFALFLYSVLPILRNTHAGLADIPQELRESAAALGLPRSARLRHVELPLAARSIIAGIKTAAVINVGTATLGALIGAGGYGQPILTGIRLDDLGLILEGAIPAAILALLVQTGFGLLERRWVRG